MESLKICTFMVSHSEVHNLPEVISRLILKLDSVEWLHSTCYSGIMYASLLLSHKSNACFVLASQALFCTACV